MPDPTRYFTPVLNGPGTSTQKAFAGLTFQRVNFRSTQFECFCVLPGNGHKINGNILFPVGNCVFPTLFKGKRSKNMTKILQFIAHQLINRFASGKNKQTPATSRLQGFPAFPPPRDFIAFATKQRGKRFRFAPQSRDRLYDLQIINRQSFLVVWSPPLLSLEGVCSILRVSI